MVRKLLGWRKRLLSGVYHNSGWGDSPFWPVWPWYDVQNLKHRKSVAPLKSFFSSSYSVLFSILSLKWFSAHVFCNLLSSSEVIKMVFNNRYEKSHLPVPSVSYNFCFKNALKRHMKKLHMVFNNFSKLLTRTCICSLGPRHVQECSKKLGNWV